MYVCVCVCARACVFIYVYMYSFFLIQSIEYSTIWTEPCENNPFGHVQTAKAEISLRIRTV